ncbi:MAG: ribonuclease VapC [Asgard group archaeon]|nr:ribonuclease VapC [Asgard group archaeon]
MTLHVILDSNILLYFAEGQFNISQELPKILHQKYELVFLSACVEELDKLEKRKKQLSKKIWFAKKFLKKIKIIKYNPSSPKTTDEKIVDYAIKHKGSSVVMTNDLPLKKLLRKNGIPVIFVKKKGHLELDGSLP